MWPFRGKPGTKDSVPFPLLSGQDDKLADEIEQVFHFVCRTGKEATDWYGRKRRPKRIWGWWLRVGVIVATAIAGLIPVFAEISTDNQGRHLIRPAWSTVALGFAALFLAFDKFGGYTSGWIRFMTTELELTRVCDAFRFEWQNSKLAWQSGVPSRQQATEMLVRARAHIQEIHAIVAEETKTWAAEFQVALRELDAAAKVTVDVKRTGAINVRLTNGDTCEHGWILSLNGGTGRPQSGQTGSVPDLLPGNHTIRAHGRIGGCDRSAEKIIAVTAGAIVDVDLTLT